MSGERLHRSAVAELTAWRAPDHGQDALRHTFLAFLAAREDGCLRACAPGHVTASTVVLDESRTHVLLTLHPRVGLWIQLGGHCEPGDDGVRAAAAREAREESGIAGLRLGPLAQLDTHPITCSLGVPTRHLDLRYVALASGRPDPVCSDESVALRWWPIDALPDRIEKTALPDLIARALAALETEPV